ncbi:hypothetical protein [Sphaerisporangium sp. TRM90804]|uniref:hypothetical protein n=1 Tax=Sphaerisporangium sp. TRM90804 TaxID=3031113 RepID=UPI00244D6AC3|nr:hypothetical protein [Sphaerisporangium sp. TRM90804]MDH2427020.1 hypothetical protein [Sphaerisporangium sp. TRM90804]
MRDPEDTLAAIDDVIADWHGSEDAMVWTATPPKRPDPATPGPARRPAEGFVERGAARSTIETPEEPGATRRPAEGHANPGAARRPAERAVAGQAAPRQARPVAAALLHGVAQWARSPAVLRMVEFANTAEGHAVIGASEHGEVHQACNCLCRHRHGDRAGICEGTAVGVLPCETPTAGLVNVPMCRPCLNAAPIPAT